MLQPLIQTVSCYQDLTHVALHNEGNELWYHICPRPS